MRLEKSCLFRVVATLAAIGFATPSASQEHPALQRGFSSDTLYQLTEIDQVNLMNGALSITIPVGQTYPVGGSFSYGLTLTYSSKLWDFEQFSEQEEDPVCTLATPAVHANGGIGWMLTLGQLLPPETAGNESKRWQYISPDGGRHGFWPTLHPKDVPDVAGKIFYTRDSSYLRLTEMGSGDWRLEFPSGDLHMFSSVGRLKRLEDRFGNAVDVTYPAGQWKLTDSHNRETILTFSSLATDGELRPFVTKVELPAFNGGTATYDFEYAQTVLRYPPTDTCHGPAGADVIVQQLTTATLPDGTTYEMTYLPDGEVASLTLPTLGRIEYGFGSYTFPTEGCDTGDRDPWIRDGSGVTSRHLYDVGGTDLGEWKYHQTLIKKPSGSTGYCSASAGHLDPDQVSQMTVTTPLEDKTQYYFSVWPNLLPQNGSPDGFQVREYGLPFDRSVSDATGTRYLSSETFDCSATGGSCSRKRSTYVRYEYERPCQPSDPESQVCDDSNRRLASERTIFHDDGGRYKDVNYSDHDGLGHYRTMETGGNFPSGNVRSTTTDYNPGHNLVLSSDLTVQSGYAMWPTGDPWVLGTFASQSVIEGGITATTQYCFDPNTGFLKRQRIQKGDSRVGTDVIVEHIPTSRGDVGTESTYGGDRTGFAVPTGVNLCGLSLTDHAYRERHTYIDGALRTSRYVDAVGSDMTHLTVDRTIDESTGLPSASRDISGVETGFEYDDIGRLTFEKPAAGHGSWIQYQYSNATSASLPARVGIAYRPNSSRAGTPLAQEEVRFDGFGRVTEERRLMPGHDWVAKKSTYDGMGHRTVATEWYDVSSPPSPVPATEFLDFDAFGRATTIRPPDGMSHDISFSYSGDRIISRTQMVATARNNSTTAIIESAFTTSEHYDRQGRLVRVVEPSSAGVTADYDYDIGNRLAGVTLTAGATTQSRSFSYDRRGFLTSESHPEKGAAVTYSDYDPRGHAWKRTDGGRSVSFMFDRAERLTQAQEADGAQRLLKSFGYATANSGTNLKKGRLETATRYNHVTIPTPLPNGYVFSDDFECGDLGAWSAVDGASTAGGTTAAAFGPCTRGSRAHEVRVTETFQYGEKGGRPSQRTTETMLGGAASETFVQSWTYNDLGQPLTVTYPSCTFSRCTGDGAGTSRTVTNQYTRGYLSGIAGYSSSISYHPSGALDTAYHSNGLRDVHQVDPNGMARPARIEVKSNPSEGTVTHWNSGAYAFDGSGNIVGMGRNYFIYDAVNRIKSAGVLPTIDNTGAHTVQGFSYDAFGNLQSMSAPSPFGRSTPTSSSTNRLQGTATYDLAGNLTGWNGAEYEFDTLDTMTRMQSGSEDWTYIYTADDERIWQYDGNSSPPFHRFTLRDLDGSVLREYTSTGDFWEVEKDYIYRGSKLHAAETSDGTRHFHLDHLGTPRLITDAVGGTTAYHVYLPFGEELTDPLQDDEQMKFTGHERDLASPDGTGDDLDYMHARHCSPVTGRFLSIDPGRDSAPAVPQSWNLYSYVRNRPLRFSDPTGLCSDPGGSGTRVCISAYIPTRTFGGFRGDNRGADASGGSFRTQHQFRLEPGDGGIHDARFSPGRSKFGPFERDAEVSGHGVRTTELGVLAEGAASDGLLFGAAPTLEYRFELLTDSDGGVSGLIGTHTSYPSFEVWVYEDGADPVLLYDYQATADGAAEGVRDITLGIEFVYIQPASPKQ